MYIYGISGGLKNLGYYRIEADLLLSRGVPRGDMARRVALNPEKTHPTLC